MEAEKITPAPGEALRPIAGNDNVGQQDDFKDPQKLPFWRKCAITAWLAGVTFTVTFCSSVWSSTFPVTAEEFHTTTTVLILGVSLYVLGFAVGPLAWGPASEVWGRKIPIFTGYSIFALLQIPISLVHSLPALLVLRFLAGAFGAAPLSLVSATYADFWGPVARGNASAIYSVVCFVGPTMGPIIGTYITQGLGWRWTSWITLIMAAFFGIPAFFIVPETYVPVLKKRPKPEMKVFLSKYLIRPMSMVRHEVMVRETHP
jgi:MFS transporter, DHA1 family, multidrug resistance protein